MHSYILYILAVLNILLFLLMGIDKYKAQHNKWRISEFTLLSLGLLCGGAGGVAGMLFFHHKTKKFKFYAANIVGIVVCTYVFRHAYFI